MCCDCQISKLTLCCGIVLYLECTCDFIEAFDHIPMMTHVAPKMCQLSICLFSHASNTQKRTFSPDTTNSAASDGTDGDYNNNINNAKSSGIMSSSVFRCSTQWPIRLIGLLRLHLSWIPGEMDAQKRVYWCILLLDTLQGACGVRCVDIGVVLCGMYWC